MPSDAFDRARRFRGPPAGLFLLRAAAVLSAVATPLLVLDLGIITQLLLIPTVEAAATGAGASGVPAVRDSFLSPDGWQAWAARWCGVSWRVGQDWLVDLAVFTGVGLFLAVVQAISLAVLYRAVHAAALDRAVTLKQAIHEQTFRLGLADLLGRATSRPDQLFSAGVDRVQQGLKEWWRAIPRAPAAIVALVLLALRVQSSVTLFAILFCVFVWWLYGLLRDDARARRRPWESEAQREHTRALEHLRLAGLASEFGLASPPGESGAAILARYRQAAAQAYAAETRRLPIFLLVVLCGAAVLVFVVGVNVLAIPQRMTVPGMVVIGTALVCAFFPTARLVRLRIHRAQAVEAAGEIFAYLDRAPPVNEVAGAKDLARLSGPIRFDHLAVADQRGRLLLDGVSLAIPADGKIGVLATDARLPSILKGLLLRQLDPSAGRILWDDLDLSHATFASLRRQTLEAPSDGAVFAGTIGENIACGGSFSSAELAESAKRTGGLDYILSLPQGMETVVGPHGQALPELEAFRLGLARALLRNPSLLLLEEPDPHDDERIETALDEAISRAAAGRTLLVFPGRAATLRWLDRILLFHEGRLVADGAHSELLLSSELYRHLIYLRFNPFRGLTT